MTGACVAAAKYCELSIMIYLPYDEAAALLAAAARRLSLASFAITIARYCSAGLKCVEETTEELRGRLRPLVLSVTLGAAGMGEDLLERLQLVSRWVDR